MTDVLLMQVPTNREKGGVKVRNSMTMWQERLAALQNSVSYSPDYEQGTPFETRQDRYTPYILLLKEFFRSFLNRSTYAAVDE